MRVIHVNTWDTGGAANAAKRICSAERKLGLDANFLSLKQTDKDDSHVFYYQDFLERRFGKRLTFIWIFLNRIFNLIPIKFNKRIFFNRPESLFRIHKHPLVQEADVVHLHATVKFLDFPSFFSHIDKPIIWTLHDMNPFSGGKHYESMMPEGKLKLEHEYLKIKMRALAGVIKMAVVSPSQWLMLLSKSSDLFRGYDHFCIPNCMDDRFNVKLATKDNKIPKVLFVAENVDDKRKGFHYLLESLSYINTQIELWILGNAQEKHFSEVSNVRFLGYINDPKRLTEIYGGVDLFVIPSLEDNLPNTIQESLVSGTPVVGFRTSGVANMIDHERNGVLVDDISGRALADGINQLLNMIRSGLIDNERIAKEAREFYDPERVARLYEEVYLEVLQKQ